MTKEWGAEFGREMVEIIKTYVAKQVSPLYQRLNALESRVTPEDMAKGIGAVMRAKIEQEAAPLLARIDALEKAPRAFDDLSVEYDGERNLVLRFTKGDRVKEFAVPLPIIIDKGVYKPEAFYVRGDAVTFGGALWICQKDTYAKPETNSDWRLAVKKGRDGRDGVTKIKHVGSDGQ